jgi:hypothetical protein
MRSCLSIPGKLQHPRTPVPGKESMACSSVTAPPCAHASSKADGPAPYVCLPSSDRKRVIQGQIVEADGFAQYISRSAPATPLRARHQRQFVQAYPCQARGRVAGSTLARRERSCPPAHSRAGGTSLPRLGKLKAMLESYPISLLHARPFVWSAIAREPSPCARTTFPKCPRARPIIQLSSRSRATAILSWNSAAARS